MKRKKILTPAITFTGEQRKIDVFSEKAPKLRFKPGQFFKYQNSVWEVIYCYRTKDEPHIWKFCLEESRDKDKMSIFLNQTCGLLTNRVMVDCFRDGMDAMTYFADIPANGDRLHVRTTELINKAVLLSSGEIL